jgi:hypothetical protein
MPILPPFDAAGNAAKFAVNSAPLPVRKVQYNNAGVNETALVESLEGIPEIGHYYEIVYRATAIASVFLPLNLFPAVRVLFRSGMYTVARAYIGRDFTTDKQSDHISELYRDGDILDYERVYPKGWGESNA